MSLLFPEEPRDFAGRRWIKIVLRGVHVLCAGVLVGAYLLQGGSLPWLLGTIASGSALLLLDLHESAAFLLEVRGLIVLIKLGLLASLPAFGAYQAWLLAFLLVGSVVSSHAPGSFRHHLLFGRGKITPSKSRG